MRIVQSMQTARFQIKSISFRNVRPYLARSIAAETGGTLFALLHATHRPFPVRVRDWAAVQPSGRLPLQLS